VGPPPVWHLAREALAVIIRFAGQAPYQLRPLSSNVRPHQPTLLCLVDNAVQLGPSIHRMPTMLKPDLASLPRAIQACCACLLLVGVLGISRSAGAGGWESPATKIFWLAAIATLVLLLAYALATRKNWMRWLLIVWLGTGLLLLPWAERTPLNTVLGAVEAGQYMLHLVIVVLLLLPATARWFRSEA
jgi:hypothetical protein